jgi:PAS domain S-box-containing protein
MKKPLHPKAEPASVPRQPIEADMWMRTEQRRLLRSVLPWVGSALGLALITVVVCTMIASATWQMWAMGLILVAALGLFARAIVACRQFRVTSSSYLLIAAVIISSVGMAVLFEELLVAYSMVGLLLVLLASVLTSLKAGYVTAVVFSFLGVLILFLQENEVLTLALPTNATQRHAIDLAVFFLSLLMGVHLVSLSQEGTRRVLRQLIGQSNEIKHTNEQLEHEVAERKQAEAALQELTTSLVDELSESTVQYRTERERSAAILRNTGDAISMTDLEMRIQYVNEAFTTITGYTVADSLGRPIWAWVAEPLPEQERRMMHQSLERNNRWQGEIIARRKDGRTYEAEMTVAPVCDADNACIGYVFSHQDISRFKDLDRARRRFIANVSHELRTPVTAIKLAVHLLEKNTNPDKIPLYRDVLRQHATRLEALIEDILEITILDSGQATMAWEPVALPELLHNILSQYTAQAQAAEIQLIADLPSPPPPVNGDPARLAQVLQELVQNALIFTPAGGRVTLGIEVVENGTQTWVALSVADTGPGIPVEEQVHVFDRFFRGKRAEAGDIPGTGLGLSIAHSIVSAHGGKITVESQEGQGSTFRVWLLAAAP